MKKKVTKKEKEFCNDLGKCCTGKSKGKGCGGCTYFLGFIGAVIYYTSTASGFWMGVLGFLKATVWPAFLVFEVLKYIGA